MNKMEQKLVNQPEISLLNIINMQKTSNMMKLQEGQNFY